MTAPRRAQCTVGELYMRGHLRLHEHRRPLRRESRGEERRRGRRRQEPVTFWILVDREGVQVRHEVVPVYPVLALDEAAQGAQVVAEGETSRRRDAGTDREMGVSSVSPWWCLHLSGHQR